MKRLMLLLTAGLAVLVAVPAAGAADRQYTVNAGGTVKDLTTNTYAKFRVDFRAGPGNKVVYTNPTTGTSFRSLRLTTMSFTANTAKINGVGLVNGKRVTFQAIAVSHPRQTGVFRISWNHQASHGGTLTFGRVRVTQISAS